MTKEELLKMAARLRKTNDEMRTEFPNLGPLVAGKLERLFEEAELAIQRGEYDHAKDLLVRASKAMKIPKA
jgi:hypothetical protein